VRWCCAVKRADEIIFNSQSGEASRVKKSDEPSAVGDDVSKEGEPVSVVKVADETEDSAKTETDVDQHQAGDGGKDSTDKGHKGKISSSSSFICSKTIVNNSNEANTM